MRKLFYLLLGLLVIAGCSSRQNEYNDVETISIQVSDTASNMSAFERFDFVKLEMTSESLLPDIAKVVTTDDRIYVLSMMDARIFIFSLFPTLKFQIARICPQHYNGIVMRIFIIIFAYSYFFKAIGFI